MTNKRELDEDGNVIGLPTMRITAAGDKPTEGPYKYDDEAVAQRIEDAREERALNDTEEVDKADFR